MKQRSNQPEGLAMDFGGEEDRAGFGLVLDAVMF